MGFVNEDRGDRTVDAAREAANDALVAHLCPDPLNRLFAVAGHGPVALEASPLYEVLVKLGALGRVVHFGVELHGIKPPRRVGCNCIGRVWRGAVNLETRSDFSHMVAMAHPDLFIALGEPAVKQIDLALRRDKRPPEFSRAAAARDLAALNAPAQLLHHHLLTVADA